MLKNIGSTEVVVVAVVLLILFGSKKIPEFIKGITKAISEGRKELD